MTLHERVTEYVRLNPGETLEEIARGLVARTTDVRDVLLGDGFSASLRLAYPSDRAHVYEVASVARDGSGRVKKPSQCDLIHRVLRDGNWHTSAEIHQRCGYSRLNSRVAELRDRRNLNIVCEHVPGAGTGPEAYRYRLVTSEGAEHPPRSVPSGAPIETPEAAETRDADGWGRHGDSAASGVSGESTPTAPAAPDTDMQLQLVEAA